jgi:peptide/nickel transport system substrate-binding protein
VRTFRARASVAALLAAVLLIPACESGSSEASDAARGSGGELTFLNFSETPTLDPARGRNNSCGGQLQLVPIFDMLAEVDATGKITPRLAESVKTDDALHWTVTLREGLVFSDGTPFDANAVTAHWDRLADPKTASPSRAEAATMKSYRAVDKRTIEVTLVARNSQWARYLMRGLGMIPSPTAVEKLGEGFASAPVGAGPFTVKEYVRDDHLTLVRNPKYWDAPRPHLATLTFRPILNPQQRADTFDSGDGDVSWEVIWSSQLAKWVDEGRDVRIPPINGGQGNIFNATKPPLDDVRVRRALWLAYDAEDLNQKVNNGKAPIVDTLFVKDSPFYNAAAKAPATNLGEAQSLIDAYVAEKGGPLKIDIMATETSRLLTETLQQQWRRLKGVETSVSVVEPAEFQRRVLSKEFVVSGGSVYGLDPEPIMYDFLHSKSAGNRGGFKSPAIDEALDAGRAAIDLEGRKAAYAAFEKAFWEELPYLLTTRLAYTTVVGEQVKDYRIIDDGLPDFTNVTMAK